jgi:hypothetical protein
MKTTVQRLKSLIAAVEAEAAAIEAVQIAAKAAKGAKRKHRTAYLEALLHDFDFPMELELALYAEDDAKEAQQKASAYLANMLTAGKYHSEGVEAAGCMQ